MKRFALPLLLWVLVGCGTLSAAPSTGELLGAPTRLNLRGGAVQVQADAAVASESFGLRLTLQGATLRRAPLSISNVYVVTRDGVWRSGAARLEPCGERCLSARVQGAARGMQRGEAAQVVLEVRDGQGRTYLLRDEAARVR